MVPSRSRWQRAAAKAEYLSPNARFVIRTTCVFLPTHGRHTVATCDFVECRPGLDLMSTSGAVCSGTSLLCSRVGPLVHLPSGQSSSTPAQRTRIKATCTARPVFRTTESPSISPMMYFSGGSPREWTLGQHTFVSVSLELCLSLVAPEHLATLPLSLSWPNAAGQSINVASTLATVGGLREDVAESGQPPLRQPPTWRQFWSRGRSGTTALCLTTPPVAQD